MTGREIVNVLALRGPFAGTSRVVGAVPRRIGGNSWPSTGTPPTPRSDWPGNGRLMIGKAFPGPLEPGLGIGRGSVPDL